MNIPQMNIPQQRVINPNQMNTGMINMNTGEFVPNVQIQQPMNTGEFVPNLQVQQPMNTGPININSTPQINEQSSIIVPQHINPNQMNTGMINMNSNQQIDSPKPIIVSQQTDSELMATSLISMQTKNNPFFDPTMNTFEFDFTNNQDDLSSDYFGKIEIDLKLEELQKIYNSNLITSEEYIIKKRDLIKKALDKL